MDSNFNIDRLVFVIGFPRSGTTWFSNLINSHPDTVYRHEIFGRDYRSFGEGLFNKLKFDHGLSDDDYASVTNTLMKARVDTDKPPFFKKNFHLVTNTKAQKLLWLGAKAAPFLEPVYSLMYSPAKAKSVVPVIKETRSSVNLDSIVKGTRTDNLVILVRHPFGVIASHISGNKSGNMGASNPDYRREWFQHNADSEYVRHTNITERDVVNAPEVEFLAINWRVQNEDYLRLHKDFGNSQVVVYEHFLEDTRHNTERLLASLGLSADENVLRFIEESSSSQSKANLITKDASSDYFSVYRSRNFDPNKWKKILSDDDIDRIEAHTKPLTAKLGLDRWVDRTA